MNNKVLRIISVLLALGAVAVGYFAIRLSQAPAPAPLVVQQAPASAPMDTVAVSVHELRAGQALVAKDIAIKAVPQAPSQAYRQMQDVVGRVVISDIPAGTALTPSLFAADSIAYLLKPGERAIAIQMDEVAAVGGYIKPGDSVDVLSFVSAGGDVEPTALVVVDNVKLLAVGNESQLDNLDRSASTGQGAPPTGKEMPIKAVNSGLSSDLGNGVDQRRLHMRSAVIAVRERDVNKLMLVANSGTLRLALRPPQGSDPNAMLTNEPKAVVRMPAKAILTDVVSRRTDRRKHVVQEGSKEHVVTNDNKADQ
jgi:pilus assembly protein CpaB